MKFHAIAIAAVSAAALIPTISNASEKTSLNACARALAATFASGTAAAPSYKVAYKANRFALSPLEFYGHEYTFDLQARDQKTGLTVVTAQCSTNSRSEVIALNTTPVDSKTQQLAAR